jgi:hypothetical protein
MSEQSKGWGGARPGSGRPRFSDEKRTAAGFSLPPDALRALSERAELEGVTRSEALTRCLREWSEANGAGDEVKGVAV